MNSEKYIEKNTPSMILNLQKLVAQPSVSATGDGIEKCAKLVSDLLKRSGIPSEILRMPSAAPLNFSYLRAGCIKEKPQKDTALFNHYDVQPAEPLDEWRKYATIWPYRYEATKCTDVDNAELICR